MTESSSDKFIAALQARRDALFAAALAAGGGPARAEALLQQTVRALFPVYARGEALPDVGAWVSAELARAGGGSGAAAAMPAAVWARLTAAVQIEAAKIGGGKALNPESVLLAPDPLLAPKRTAHVEDEIDGLGFSAGQRFIVATLIALVVGVGLTVYLARHWHGSTATQPAATAHTQHA